MLREQIENYIPYNDQEEIDKKVCLSFIDNFDNFLDRENVYGHFCSSAFIVNNDFTKVLMVYHNIFNSWAWVGGHADGNEDMLNVSIKESLEETGIKNVVPVLTNIFSIDITPVKGHYKRGKYVSAHTHPTVTFLLMANENEELIVKEDENSQVKWINIDDIVNSSTEPHMKIIYQKVIDKINDYKKTTFN